MPIRPPRSPTTRALIRFHWRSGARVALRANGVVGASILFLFALDMDALAHLRVAVLQIVAQGHGWNARAELAGISVILAALAMPRVTLGATGWMRSLPVSASTSRRAAVAALTSVQVFAITFAALAACAAVTVYGARLDVAKLASLPVVFVAAAMFVLPVRLSAGRIASATALAFAVPGRWTTTAAAIVSLVVADRCSGGIVPFRRKHREHSRIAKRPWIGQSATALWMRFTLRTLPVSTIASCLLLPAIFTAFSALIVLHNPDIDRDTAMRTVRIGGMMAKISLTAGLASSIARTRPAWPWARSLPWSARQRVMGDTALHAVGLAMIPLYFAFIDWRSALVVAMCLPALAAASAGAIRASARRQTSAAGEITALGTTVGALIALWPWSAGLAVASAPLLFTAPVQRERRFITTRWEELHHDAAGDPAWTSPS